MVAAGWLRAAQNPFTLLVYRGRDFNYEICG